MNRTRFDDVMKNDPFFHNHFYPVIGDHDNETRLYYNGISGLQTDWGRGWVIFKSLNNFFNRSDVEFRPKQSSKVLSGGKYYDDQLIDYHAKRKEAGFTVPREERVCVGSISKNIALLLKNIIADRKILRGYSA